MLNTEPAAPDADRRPSAWTAALVAYSFIAVVAVLGYFIDMRLCLTALLAAAVSLGSTLMEKLLGLMSRRPDRAPARREPWWFGVGAAVALLIAAVAYGTSVDLSVAGFFAGLSLYCAQSAWLTRGAAL